MDMRPVTVAADQTGTSEAIVNVLCIGEGMREFTARLNADGTLSDKKDTGLYAGDIGINVPAQLVAAAEAIGQPIKVDVLTAFPVQDALQTAEAEAFMRQRGINIHKDSKYLRGEIGEVINLINPDGTTPKEKVRMKREHSPFRQLFDGASDDELRQMVKGYDYIAVSGVVMAALQSRGRLIRLLELAKEQNPAPQIIVSTNLRGPTWCMPSRENPQGLDFDKGEWKEPAQRWLDQMVKLADMVFANREDEFNLRGRNHPHEILSHLRCMNQHAPLVLTDDGNPIHVLHGGHAVEQIISLPIAKADVVESVGAGDAVFAAGLAGLMKGSDLETAVFWGSNLAAQVVGIKGALLPHGQKFNYPPRILGALNAC